LSRIYNKQVEAEYSQLFEDLYNKTVIKILLLGPNTKETHPGSQLRKYIARKCKGQRHTLYAERKRLINSYTKMSGKYSDFCDYEKRLAELANAIIIIPDSAGSLVELGLFVFRDDMHEKILVLFSNEYPASCLNFINLGPRKAYNIRNAWVKDIDYRNKKAAWSIVDDFLDKRKQIVCSRKSLHLE